jgi:hypothetical protein
MATHPPRRTVSTPVYFFLCPACRRQVLVHPNQAGAKLDCACGTRNTVPSIMHLTRLADEAGPPGKAAAPVAPAPQAGPGISAAPQCPFCRCPLQAGRIIGERYQLKWLSNDIPLTLGIWAVGGHPIGHGGFMQFNRPHVYGWRCANCCKIIVDERA